VQHLDERVRALLDGKNLAHVATVGRDGRPRVHPTWVGRDGDTVLLNTQEGRVWPKRLRRAGWVSLSIANRDDETEYVEIVGRVSGESGEDAAENIDVLSQRYLGIDYPMHFDGEERVLFRIEPERVNYVNLAEHVPGVPDEFQPGA
jgi:PPOX class probable F420-dependent enzyme